MARLPVNFVPHWQQYCLTRCECHKTLSSYDIMLCVALSRRAEAIAEGMGSFAEEIHSTLESSTSQI